MKNLTRYSYLIIVYAFLSCSSSPNEVSLLVDIPIAEDKIVSIHNLSNGAHVYHDTLRGKVVLDSPSHGIHLLTVMWDRDVLSPEEFRSLRPHTLDNPSYYSLQKLVFIDPKQGGAIRLYTPDSITKETIEEQLLSSERMFAPFVELEGKHAQLYETYESILHRYRLRFRIQRDSLKNLLYSYNDTGYLQQAAAINLQINELWKNTISPKYEKEEKQFLMEHADQIIVPFILLNRVTSRELYQSFKPVIDAMPMKYQELRFIQGLAKLRSEKRKGTEPTTAE